ncbi:type IX secretion system protein PorD [Pedobacter sp.]
MKKTIGLLLLTLACFAVNAQELNTRVQILAPTVNNANKRNLDVLQNTIRDFMNNNKWTTETYLPQEKIDCNLVINITAWDGNAAYTAEAQIQSSRPVYGSSYTATLLNMADKDFSFSFNEGQSLDFSDQNFISNLSSLLGFYAYTIIGLDKDSFSKLGGTPYYQKALNLINLAQNAGGKGWRPVDGLRNRYWLNENLMNNSFKSLRTFIYEYHLNGLDKLQGNTDSGTKSILSSLSSLKQFDKQKMGSIFPNVYFATKADEITNVLSLAEPQDRMKAYNLLVEIDPPNTSKYDGLKKRN